MKTYHLESKRDELRFVMDARMLDPIRFNSRFSAWFFKARHGKWHWNVVADGTDAPTQEPRQRTAIPPSSETAAPPNPTEFEGLVQNVITISVPIPALHGANTPPSR